MNMTQTALVPASPSIPSDVAVVEPESASPCSDSIRCITHDLNNSVQATLSTLQLLQGRLQRGLTEDMPKLIEQAVVSAALASKTGRRLMNVSQSAPGTATTCGVKGLVASMEPVLKHVLGPTSELILAFDSSSPTVNCDPSRLQNVLLNLVINAKDAMPNGGTVVLSVSGAEAACAHATGVSRHHARIVVTDTGQGMTREVLDCACIEFFTTKAFIDELEGSLDIQSTTGCGTSVSILLPCGETSDQTRAST
jgi:signal transduction histidine kinase